MKKKTTKANVNNIPAENSNPRADDSTTNDELVKPDFSLPVHKAKILLSEEELKEEINKII